MEHKNPSVAKTLHNMMRVILYTLRNGMSKGKAIMDFNAMMKRGKIASKAIQNLVLLQHQRSISCSAPREYEFSCSNSPAVFPFHISKKGCSSFCACARAPVTEEEDLVTANAVKTALERLHGVGASSLEVGQSPTAPGSPWLLSEEDSQVDEAATEFINKFYRNLKKENAWALKY